MPAGFKSTRYRLVVSQSSALVRDVATTALEKMIPAGPSCTRSKLDAAIAHRKARALGGGVVLGSIKHARDRASSSPSRLPEMRGGRPRQAAARGARPRGAGRARGDALKHLAATADVR